MITRTRFTALIFAGIVVFAFGSCGGKKAPGGAASAAGTGTGAGDTGTSKEGTSSDVTSGGSGASGDVLSNMPIIYFEYNQASVPSDARGPLKKAAEQLKGKTGIQMTIEGHCDERGSSEYNLALGERRAQSVKAYLRTLGVEGSQLSTISYGKERPADPGHNEAAWAKNRRAEIIVNR